MTAFSAPARQVAEALLGAVEACSKVGFVHFSEGEWGALNLDAARAYVWATFLGVDPIRAIGRKLYGDLGLYERDPVWCDEPDRHRSRTHRCINQARALEKMRLNIPRTVGPAFTGQVKTALAGLTQAAA